MRKFFRVMAILLSMCLLTGCVQEAAPTEPTEPVDPSAVYLQATAPISSVREMRYRVEAAHSVTVGPDTYWETANQTICYKDPGADTFCASVTEDTIYGDYQVQIRDHFLEGVRYLEVNGSYFSNAESADAFLARYAPAVLIDASLYNSITYEEAEEGMTITFADASAAESWLGIDEITDASGSATIATDGTLLESRYSVTYPSGDRTVRKSFTVTMLSFEFTAPQEPQAHLPLDAPAAAGLLEAACGYLSQAGNVTSKIEERLVSDAAGLARERTSDIRMASTDGKFLAQLDHTITVTDANHGDMTFTVTHRELHRNGHYILDGHSDGNALTAGQMHDYIIDLLVEHVLLPQHLTQATIQIQDGTYLLEFTCSEELAQILGQLAAKELLEDAHVLNSLADSYRTISAVGWLRMDAQTHLPLGLGVDYQGEHTIDGYSYAIAYQLEQSFRLGDQGVRDAILSD